MDLPVMPPVEPMLARSSAEIPPGDFFYEPKWDGFRCIAFCDGPQVELQSRNCRSLSRYFPELTAQMGEVLATKCVLDGEIVIAGPRGLDFEALSGRIHPASSRVATLAETRPASFVAFDVLAVGDTLTTGEPFRVRREILEGIFADSRPPLHLTPVTKNLLVAGEWFARFEGAGLDGIVAKPAGLAYLPARREMIKVKHRRTGEFVVGGFRWHRADPSMVGSLMLGLYDGPDLHHVGVIGSFPVAQRRKLVEDLDGYRNPSRHPWVAASFDRGPEHDGGVEMGLDERLGRGPSYPSRWSAGKDMSFEALRPHLVVEAEFEQLQAGRLRHTARFVRWRPDREPASATFDQLDVAVPVLLSEVFGAGSAGVEGAGSAGVEA
ncbi:MAG: ATP-dependent DNA ligase [Acidimicrobiales bacterium]